MHEKHVFIHIFMQIIMNFYDGQLKQQICYNFTLFISYMIFYLVKMVDQFFWAASSLPNFDGPKGFYPYSTGPISER